MKLPSHFNSVKGFIDHNEGICLYNYALNSSKKGGSIEISYFSDDDLERIIDLINTIS